jgi:hypothetical protein
MLKPGKYKNKRGEDFDLVPLEGNDNLLTNSDQSRFYSNTGTCMFWNSKIERYLLDTDPKSDLQLSTPAPKKCGECGRDLEK